MNDIDSNSSKKEVKQSDEFEEEKEKRKKEIIISKKQPPPWPYKAYCTPFVRLVSDNYNNNNNNKIMNDFLCILGGELDNETKFYQYICDSNKMIDFINLQSISNANNNKNNKNNKTNVKKTTNSDLKYINGMNSGRYIESYLIFNDTIGYCIIILHRDYGYNVYNIDNDEWIVTNDETIKNIDFDYARSLLVWQSYVCNSVFVLGRTLTVLHF